jgi:predicted transcriptional regulator
MSNTIIIELCAEDRARLDRIAEKLDRMTAPVTGANPAPEVKQEVKTPAEPPEQPTEATEAAALPVTQPEGETPTEAQEIAPAETTEPSVTLAEIQQKVVQLAAGSDASKKAAVRGIVNAYAKKVTDLPEDKWTEVWEKLIALESEG